MILSAERPAGHTGDWWELREQTVRLLMRRCSCDWTNEVDARVAINRLDDDGADMSTPEDTARRFSELAEWIEGTIQFDMGLVRYYREHHGVNTFLRSSKIDEMGGLPRQAYYDGIHEIDDDEALILETPLPTECRYWQALVADDRFATVDWVNRQSSLNDAQAHVDADGWFRAVISHARPRRAELARQGRLPVGHHPDALLRGQRVPGRRVIKKVKVADVRAHLPADTPVGHPDERREQLRARPRGRAAPAHLVRASLGEAGLAIRCPGTSRWTRCCRCRRRSAR